MSKVNDVYSDVEWTKTINEHFNSCTEKDVSFEYQVSYITFLNSKMEIETCYIANKVLYKIQSEKLYIKPKGRYLKMIHLGKYDPEKVYKEAKAYADSNNLKIKGMV